LASTRGYWADLQEASKGAARAAGGGGAVGAAGSGGARGRAAIVRSSSGGSMDCGLSAV